MGHIYPWQISIGDYNKVKSRKIGNCDVLQKINDNAYKLCFRSHLKISDVFNVQHLTPYLKKENNSRMSSLQPGKNDATGLVEIEGYEYLCEDLTLLDENLIYVNYMDDLTVTFMN